jgi:multidrug transporter EmrE-like cation transporter
MPTHFAPMDDGDYLLLTEDEQFNDQEIGRHSKKDVDGYHRWNHDLERVIQLAKPLFDNTPPDIFSDDPDDRADVAWMMKQLGGADRKTLHDLIRFLTGSAADLLDDYFESDIVKASIASSSIIGNKVGPMSQGSGLVLLYHLMGEQDGHSGVWGFHKGGNGGFTQVLQRAAQAFGATVKLEAPVDHVITKDGRATGVALTDGTEYAAPIVVSALDPRRTFTELVDPRELPTDLNEAIARYRFQGTSAKVNFALDDLPVYPALKGRIDHYGGFINIAPSMEYLERAYDDAKYGWYSQKPYIVGGRPRHGASRQARDELLHPVRPVRAQGQRLGDRAATVRGHGAGRPRVALPGLRRPGAAPRGRDPARHRAGRRPQRGQHLPRRVPGTADVLHAAGARLCPLQHPDRGLLPVRLGHPPGRLRDRWSGQAGRDADPGRPSEEGMTAWLLLASAIVCEVSATLSLKRALDQPALYAVVVAGYVAAFVLLTLTLKQGMGIGIAYGIWAACGVALTAVASKLLFSEPLTNLMMAGITLIIAGVLLVELGASH